MNRYIYLGLLLISSALISAQNKQNPLAVTWGKELKSPSGTSLYKVVESSSSGFTTVRIKKAGLLNTSQKVIFEKYDQSLGIVKSKESELKFKNKDMDFEESFAMGDKIYLFSSFANQKDSKRYLFGQELRETSLTPEKKLSYIDEMHFSLLSDVYNYEFSISPDSTHLLVYHAIPGKKNDPAKYNFVVLDKDLNKLWEREYALSGKLSSHIIENAKVDNDGNAYVLLSTTFDSKLNNPEDEKYKLISIKKDIPEPYEFDISLKNQFINGINFKVLKGNMMVCAGFYSNRGINSIKGVFYYTIDLSTQQIIKQSTKEFDFNFATSHLSEGRRDRLRASSRGDAAPELPKFNLDQLILRGDGGALLLAEQFNYMVYSDYDYFTNNIRNRYIYQFDDIVAVSVSPEGNIDWATRVPKRQETQDDDGIYSSYCYGVTGDHIVLMYNDNTKNYFKDRKEGVQYEFDGYRGQPAYSMINSDGQFSSGLLENSGDDRYFLQPRVCKQIGANKILIYKELNGRYRWGVVGVQRN